MEYMEKVATVEWRPATMWTTYGSPVAAKRGGFPVQSVFETQLEPEWAGCWQRPSRVTPEAPHAGWTVPTAGV